ncbi:MAG: DUF167 domain-containing protein [Chloroflexi bacterium]|nr:DUF167 domain-containing protein [Chloroflexota bacterium]
MTPSKPRFHDGTHGAAIAVKVTPRARKNEITDILDNGTVKIRLTAPPIEGKANEALIHFLAETLGIAPTLIEIVAGASGRDKLVSIQELDPASVQQKLVQALKKK